MFFGLQPVYCIPDIRTRFFDGVIAHAILDHLTVEDAKIALSELLRITKRDGLVMISFDIPEEDDFREAHILNENKMFSVNVVEEHKQWMSNKR